MLKLNFDILCFLCFSDGGRNFFDDSFGDFCFMMLMKFASNDFFWQAGGDGILMWIYDGDYAAFWYWRGIWDYWVKNKLMRLLENCWALSFGWNILGWGSIILKISILLIMELISHSCGSFWLEFNSKTSLAAQFQVSLFIGGPRFEFKSKTPTNPNLMTQNTHFSIKISFWMKVNYFNRLKFIES